MTSLPSEDPARAYQQAERRLRELLFGDGSVTAGLVKGEERRLEVTRILRRMHEAFEEAAEVEPGRAEVAEARVADLEDELRHLAAQSRELPDPGA